jgi:hypothetical protein
MKLLMPRKTHIRSRLEKVLIIGVPLLIFIGVHGLYRSVAEFKHNVRAHKNLDAFADANIEHRRIYRFEINGSSYIWWDAEKSKWDFFGRWFPTSQTVYIFDGVGDLVDHTVNAYDDRRFQQQWMYPDVLKTRKEITIEELLHPVTHDLENVREEKGE